MPKIALSMKPKLLEASTSLVGGVGGGGTEGGAGGIEGGGEETDISMKESFESVDGTVFMWTVWAVGAGLRDMPPNIESAAGAGEGEGLPELEVFNDIPPNMSATGAGIGAGIEGGGAAGASTTTASLSPKLSRSTTSSCTYTCTCC